MEQNRLNCEFCNYTYLPEYIPVRHLNKKEIPCVITQGLFKKELSMSINRSRYAIEINFCPFCGRKLEDRRWD